VISTFLTIDISVKISAIKAAINTLWLRGMAGKTKGSQSGFSTHTRSLLKFYLDCCWLSKNQILVQLYNVITWDILIMLQQYMGEFSRHLE
jgi:hypothetical protein